MTELSRQLIKLNQEYGAAASPATGKGQKSLLWTSAEASLKSMDDVYHVGRNGYLGLVALDLSFKQFEQSLFGLEQLQTDRQLLSHEDNAALDRTLQQFFRLLGCYLLHPPALKAFEWLLRRFRVHELNVPAVLSCALPYHETNLFVKILQCLRLRPPSPHASTSTSTNPLHSLFSWLDPIRLSGLPLPRPLFVERCLRAPELLAFVASEARQSVRDGLPSKPLLSLYTSLALGLLTARDGPPSEPLVNQLLPFLVDAFQHHSLEYLFSSHLLIAQLSRRAPLSPSLSSSLFRHLVDSLRPSLSPSLPLQRSALLALLALAQFQPPFRLSRKALRRFLDIPQLSLLLADPSLSAAYDWAPLLRLLLKATATRLSLPASLGPLQTLLSHFSFAEANVFALVKQLLRRFHEDKDDGDAAGHPSLFQQLQQEQPVPQKSAPAKKSAKKSSSSTTTSSQPSPHAASNPNPTLSTVRAILLQLDLHYPAAFDRALSKYLPKYSSAAVILLLDTAFAHTRHQIFSLDDPHHPATTLSLALDHPAAAIRIEALRKLNAIPHQLDIWAQEALRRRLDDPEPQVVAAVLNSPHFQDLHPAESVFPHLVALVDLARHHHLHRVASDSEQQQQQRHSSSVISDNALLAIKLILQSLSACPERHYTTTALKLILPLLIAHADTFAFNRRCCALMVKYCPAFPLSQRFRDSHTAKLTVKQFNALLIQEIAQMIAHHSATGPDHAQVLMELYQHADAPLLLRGFLQLVFSHALSQWPSFQLSRHLFLMLQIAVLPFLNDTLSGKPAPYLPLTEDAELPGVAAKWSELLGLHSSLKAAHEDLSTNILQLSLASLLTLIQHIPLSDEESPALLRDFFVFFTCASSKLFEALGQHFAAFFKRTFGAQLADLIAFLVSFFNPTPESAEVHIPVLTALRAIHITHSLIRALSDCRNDLDQAIQSTLLPACLVGVCSAEILVRSSCIELLKDIGTLLGHAPTRYHPLDTLSHTLAQRLIQSVEDFRNDFLASPETAITSYFMTKLSSQSSSVAAIQQYIINRILALEAAQEYHAATVLIALFISPAPTIASVQQLFPLLKDYLCVEVEPEPGFLLLITELLKQISATTLVDILKFEPDLFQSLFQFILDAIHSSAFSSCMLQHLTIHADIWSLLSTAQQTLLFEQLACLVLTDGGEIVGTGLALVRELLAALPLKPSFVAGYLTTQLQSLQQLVTPAPVRGTKKKNTKSSAGGAAQRSSAPAVVSSAGSYISLLLEILHAHQAFLVDYAIPAQPAAQVLTPTTSSTQAKKSETCEVILPPLFDTLALVLLNPDVNVLASFTYLSIEQTAHYILILLHDIFTNFVAAILAGRSTPQGNAGISTPASKYVQQLESKYQQYLPILIQCLQTSANAQTQNRLLLLLSELSRVFPQSIIKHILPLFTIMGTQTVMRDDNYTFNVIQHTIQALVPPLCQHGGELIKQMVNLFVDSFYNIPNHRRMIFYAILVNSISTERLHFVISALLRGAQPKVDENEDTKVEFALELASQFVPVAVVNNFVNMTNAANQLEDQEGLLDGAYLIKLFALIADYLSSKAVISKILKFSADLDKKMQIQFHRLFMATVLSIEKAQQQKLVPVFDAGFQVLERLNDLLAIATFVQAISVLLNHPSASVRQRSLVLFNDKITEHQKFHQLDEHETKLLLDLVPKLSTIAATEQEAAANRQVAFMGLEILVRNLGAANPGIFVAQSLGPVVDALQDSTNQLVVGAATICLASHCAELGTLVLPHLPRFAVGVLDRLEGALNAQANDATDDADPDSFSANISLYRLTLLSGLEIILLHCANLMSPYIHRLLICLVSPILLKSTANIVEKVDRLLELCATLVPLRLLWPALKQTWKNLTEPQSSKAKHPKKARSTASAGATAVSPLIEASIVKLADFAGKSILAVTSQEVLFQQHKRIFKIFLSLFNFRCKHHAAYPHFNIDLFEEHAFTAFIGMVLKLNENLFKPLFIRALEWSQANPDSPGSLIEVEQIVTTASPERMLTFLRFVHQVSAALKGIFVPYYGYLLDPYIAYMTHPLMLSGDNKVPEHLGKNKKHRVANTTPPSALSESGHLIIVSILNGLESCFLYDDQGFLTVDKFNKILMPLVNLMDFRGSDEHYDEISFALVSCISQLAVALGKDSLWKTLNYQILLKSRSRSSRTKLTVLSILKKFYTVIGEEFLVHLPESAPFLSELMEDSDPRVEFAVQELIGQIDSLLGEGQSISDYF